MLCISFDYIYNYTQLIDIDFFYCSNIGPE